MIATMAKDRRELHDSRFAVRGVEDHKARFGQAPGAWPTIVRDGARPMWRRCSELGVKQAGLAPQGRAMVVEQAGLPWRGDRGARDHAPEYPGQTVV